MLLQSKILKLRSDNETEFKNAKINEYLVIEVISQKFSAARTPHQNGVVERRNNILVEFCCTMLESFGFQSIFKHKQYQQPISPKIDQ